MKAEVKCGLRVKSGGDCGLPVRHSSEHFREDERCEYVGLLPARKDERCRLRRGHAQPMHNVG